MSSIVTLPDEESFAQGNPHSTQTSYHPGPHGLERHLRVQLLDGRKITAIVKEKGDLVSLIDRNKGKEIRIEAFLTQRMSKADRPLVRMAPF